MKNLKKALVLVLAFAMVFGMFTMNASAASFADDDAIVNAEAVDAMAELGVINGYEDGSFLPTQVVTRAEMCKMICVALNGGNAPLLGSSAAMFSDTVGHWANSYINYCYSAGIVSGDAGKGGAFRPDATVTALEASKMMLVALGYNSAIAGYTGADWDNNVAMDANRKNLFENIGSVNAAAGLTRDNAAQLIFNGMNAELVEYTNNYVIGPDGNLVPSPTVKDQKNETILSEKFRVKFDYGQVTAVGKETFSVTLDSSLGTSVSVGIAGVQGYTKVTSDYTALLGQSVRVMFKGTTDKVLGVVAFEKNKVVTANMSAIEAGSTSNSVKFGGTTYTTENATSGQIDTITIAANGTITPATVAVSTLVGNTTSYNTVKFVDYDGDNKYEMAVITTVTPAKVTYVSGTEIIAGNSYKFSSNNIADGIAKNDYVAISYNLFQGKRDIVEISKESGVLAVDSGVTNYKVNDTWYYKGAATLGAADAGKTVDYYVCNGVFVFGKVSTTTTTASNVVMVLNTDATLAGNQAKVLYSDGTKKVVDVATTSTVPYGSLTAGAMYTISEATGGMSFKAAASFGSYTWVDGAGADIALTGADGTKPTGAIGATTIDATAIVYVFNPDTADGKVITGSQLKTINGCAAATATVNEVSTTSKGYFTSKVNGLTRATVVGVSMSDTGAAGVGGTGVLPTVGDTARKYALIVDSAYQADSSYIYYTIWNGTNTEIVKEKNVAALATRIQSAVIKYSSIVDGQIKDVTAMTLTDGYNAAAAADTLYATAVVGLTSTKLYTTQTNGYDLDSDTVYMYYDSSATSADAMGMSGGEIALADKAAESTILVPNVKFVRDSENDVVFVLVDIKNKLVDASSKALMAITATAAPDALVANGSAAYSKTSDITLGEVLSVTVTGSGAGLSGATITLTNAVFADTGLTTKVVTIAAGASETYSIVATAQGAVISIN